MKKEILKKIQKIMNTDFAHENAFAYKQCPKIGLAIRNSIIKHLRLSLVSDNRGYGYYSGTFQYPPTGMLLYINIDYACGTNIKKTFGLDRILYRIATNAKDIHTATNYYTDIDKLIDVVATMKGGEIRCLK